MNEIEKAKEYGRDYYIKDSLRYEMSKNLTVKEIQP